MKHAGRMGLIILLGALGAFEALFMAERARGHEALAAERSLRSARATELLRDELTRELDVAEARVEALETLPLLEEDRLLWVHDGVQRAPRVAGVLATDDAAALSLLRAIIDGGAGDETRRTQVEVIRDDGGASRGAAVRRGSEPRDGGAPRGADVGEAPDAPGRGAKVRDPRGADVRGGETPDATSRAEVRDGGAPRGADRGGETPDATRRGAESATLDPRAFSRAVARPGTPAERLFRAWPWLDRKEAASLCVRLQRQDPKDTSLAAACQRGLAGTVVALPPLAADVVTLVASPDGRRWLAVQREVDVRGAELNLPATLERVTELLHRRAVLEETDGVRVLEAQPLPSLELISPRLDEADQSLISAFWLKTSLLFITALLGVAVIALMRLTEARERQSLALQREFIATVSHELRTPLAGIRVLAETLERKLHSDSAAKDYPKRLVAAVDGLGFLVENILSFNRIEAGRLTPKKESFALSSLEPMLREDIALMPERPVQLTCEGLAALGSVNADVTLLRILALNLLRNTWKYARPDNPTPQLTLAGRIDGARVVVTFTDDGPGIPTEAHERVFEPFHRQPGAESSNVRGSGLGLALSRRIAQLHDGTLRISAASDRGTTFELTLPR